MNKPKIHDPEVKLYRILSKSTIALAKKRL